MKNVILLISMLLWSVIVISQIENDKYDSKFRFGFNLGSNYSNLQSKEILPNNAKISNGIGFSLGVFMDYLITESFIFSPKSELSFYNSSVEFVNNDNFKYTYEIFPISLNLMTHFVYKIGNSKVIPYFFAGPNFKIPISKKPHSSSEFYTNSDFAIDFGIGLENRTKYFIFAPELKYSFGLLNINESPNLQTLNFHSISLIINFICEEPRELEL
ncbi:MAG: PorT family protein [Chlorobi bacterium]|nr:PorT family protein [Chlorobiota bacterium]